MTAYVWVDGQEMMRLVDSDGRGTAEGFRVANRYLYASAVDQLLADEQFTANTGPRVGASTGSSTAGNTLWPLTDQLGSVRDVVDNSGVIRQHVIYDSFGNRVVEADYNASGAQISSTDPSAIDELFGYTGRAWDTDVKLQYNRARWYDPSTGRWMSQDPIGFAAGDANLYRYVSNGPTNATDPSGLLGEGHHWVPLSVARDFYNKGLISLKDYRYFGGRTSGPLVVRHYWDEDHKRYNEHVREQLQKWIEYNKSASEKGKITISELTDNIRDGLTFDGKPSANDYNNRRVIPNASSDKKIKENFDGGTREMIETRGTESIARRDKNRLKTLLDCSLSTDLAEPKGLMMRAIAIVGWVCGAAGHAGNAFAAGDVLTDSRAIREAKRAAERGDIVGVERWLVDMGLKEPSVFEELLTIDKVAALAFYKSVISSIEAYKRGECNDVEDAQIAP